MATNANRIGGLILLLSTSSIVPVASLLAQTVAADGRTEVYTSANGVTVVDIANPNGSGLSHNRFTDYNVDAKGMVLNNVTATVLSSQSQLAGEVLSNAHLDSQASVILNEVVSNRPSSLSGFTEVLGQKAAVIVANPYGITCNGCGFINSDAVTLATGLPHFNASGGYAGVDISQGTISIGGTGLNATDQDYIALLGRKVELGAQINGQNVDIIAGAGHWDDASRTWTAKAASGAPDYAIEADLLGSVYGNRIRLIATDAGVGVKSAADMAASGGEFEISADGKIELSGDLSSKAGLSVTSDNGDINFLGSDITTASGVAINAGIGSAWLEKSTLVAGGDVAIDARQLSMTNGTTLAGADISLKSAEDAALTDADAVASGALSLTAGTNVGSTGTFVAQNGSLTVDAGGNVNIGSLSASSGNLDISGQSVKVATLAQASGDVTIDSNSLINNGVVRAAGGDVAITNAANLDNNGTIEASHDVSIDIATSSALASNNGAGKIKAANAFSANGGNFLNSGSMEAGSIGFTVGQLSNSGTMASNSTIDASGGTVISSNGNMSALGAIDLAATNITLNGTITGNSDIDAAASEKLAIGGRVDGGDITLGGKTFDVTGNGKVVASGDLLMGANQLLTNNGLLQGATLYLAADNLDQYGTFLTSSGDLTLNISGLLRNVGTTQAEATLKILNKGSPATNLSLRNQGTLSGGSVVIGDSSRRDIVFLNDLQEGTITGDSVDISVVSLENAGLVQANNSATINISDSFTNQSGGEILSGGSIDLVTADATGEIVNEGLVEAAGTATVSMASGGVTKKFSMAGADAVLRGQTVNARADDIALSGGALLQADKYDIATDYLNVADASSRIIGTGNVKSYINATLTDNAGVIYTSGDLQYSGIGITNKATAALGAGGLLKIALNNTTGTLINDGAIFADEMSASMSSFTNRGEIDLTGDSSINATTILNDGGVIRATGDLTLDADEITNRITGGSSNWAWNYAGTGFNAGDASDYTAAHGMESGGAHPAGISGTEDWSAAYGAVTEYSSNNGILNDKDFHFGFNTRQQWKNGRPTNDMIGQILVDGTLRFANFDKVTNLGSQIYGTSVEFNGNDSGSIIRNDAIELVEQSWDVTYTNDYQVGGYVNFTNYNKQVVNSTTLDTFGASITGGTVTINQGTLQNVGGATQGIGSQSVTATTGSYSGDSANGLQNTGGSTALTGNSASASSFSISLAGITLSLPTNPNGRFIIATNPSSQYLIESNPLYLGTGGIGSDLLFERLGVDTDTVQRRLGDPAYEAYLVQQQLIAASGAAALQAGETSADQLERLLTNAADLAGTAGLELGVALTDEQIAGLDRDLVWMVEQEVNGEKVLVPVVYLSAATRENLNAGEALVGGGSFVMNGGGSILNQNGVIAADDINVDISGSVTNDGGTIKGGDVSISADEGIVSKSNLTTDGTGLQRRASISAENDLTLDTEGNIDIIASDVSAGNTASLNAGGDINFGTVTTKNGYGDPQTDDDYNIVTHDVGSTLNVGNNLSTNSGGDTRFVAADVNVGGNADMTAGGDLEFLAGRDTQTYGYKTDEKNADGPGNKNRVKTDVDGFTATNQGTTVNIGGNANFTAGDMTLQGSDVNVGGNGTINADNVNVLAGYDEHRETKSTKTTSWGITRSSKGDDNGTETELTSDAGHGPASGDFEYKAEGKATADASGDAIIWEKTKEFTSTDEKLAVGSSLNFGGNATINADVNVVGSDVGSEGAMEINGDINVTTAQNYSNVITDTKTNSVGALAETRNKAEGSAGVKGSGGAGGGALSASVSGSVETDNSVSLWERNRTSTNTTDITNVGGSISGGTGLTVNGDVNVHGSTLASGGDVTLNSENQNFTAAEDYHSSTETSKNFQLGLYGNASAAAQANAGATAGMASAGASAGAQANGGLEFRNDTSVTSTQSGTAVTSGIVAGGNVTRNVTGNLMDEGTTINAGGNITNDVGGDWTATAARDWSETNSANNSTTVRVGGYADAEAGASVGASTGTVGVNADVGASAGVQIGVKNSSEKTGESTDIAHGISFTAGGNIESTSGGATTIEGGNFDADGDISLTGSSVNLNEARSSITQTSDSTEVNVGVKGGVSATKAITGSLNVGVEDKNASHSENVGTGTNLSSGGNLTIKSTSGDVNLQGTTATSGGDMSIDSAGNVNMTAITNEVTDTSDTTNVSFAIGGGTKDGAVKDKGASGGTNATGGSNSSGSGSTSGSSSSGPKLGSVTVGLDVGVQSENNSTVSETGGSLASGGNMTIKSQGDTNLQGTDLSAGGQGSIDAGGNVNITATKTVTTNASTDVGVSLSGSYSAPDDSSKNTASNSGGNNSGGNNTGNSGTASNSGAKKKEEPVSGKGSLSVNRDKITDTEYDGANITGEGGFTVNAGGSTSSENLGGNVTVNGNHDATVLDDDSKNESFNIDVGVGRNLGKNKENTGTGGAGGAAAPTAGATTP